MTTDAGVVDDALRMRLLAVSEWEQGYGRIVEARIIGRSDCNGYETIVVVALVERRDNRVRRFRRIAIVTRSTSVHRGRRISGVMFVRQECAMDVARALRTAIDVPFEADEAAGEAAGELAAKED
jgi:hypothetical protein